MRTIRLKETEPGSRTLLTPAADYRELTDESLPSGPFLRRGTADGFLHTGDEREAATRSLILLGDSFVETVYCDEAERFPALLEQTLPEEWRVLNGGYSGMTTAHMLTLVAAKIPPLMSPGSRLVLFVGQSDVFALQSPGAYWSLSDRITPLLPPPTTSEVTWDRTEALERTIDALLALVVAFRFDVGVVAAPFRDGDFRTDSLLRAWYKDSDETYARFTRIRRMIQRVVATAATRHELPFLDGQSAVTPADFYDSLHLNPAGQHVFSQAMSGWLKSW